MEGRKEYPDPPVPGMIEWLKDFMWELCNPPDSVCAMAPEMDYEICIYSSRSRQWGGKIAMRRWLIKYGMEPEWVGTIKFPTKKPAAFLTIDDRAIRFRGTRTHIESLTDEIINFVPWHKVPDKYK